MKVEQPWWSCGCPAIRLQDKGQHMLWWLCEITSSYASMCRGSAPNKSNWCAMHGVTDLVSVHATIMGQAHTDSHIKCMQYFSSSHHWLFTSCKQRVSNFRLLHVLFIGSLFTCAWVTLQIARTGGCWFCVPTIQALNYINLCVLDFPASLGKLSQHNAHWVTGYST